MLKNGKSLFTSESVSSGHPDKICDQVSDSILDLYISRDPRSKVAVETVVTTNFMMILGEVSGKNSPSLEEIEKEARKTIKNIGYSQKNFHYKTLTFQNRLHEQSPDIAIGVDEGAGDQGIMFGYAVNETVEKIPSPLFYSHRILESLNEFRNNGNQKIFGPDAKSQVTLLYEDGIPVSVDTVVLSTQHGEDVSLDDIKVLLDPIIKKSFENNIDTNSIKTHINPTGRFVVGGPDGDAGLTGRKIIVDTYGGAAPHGGGAFSGKDPSKVDRSAAYISRYIAKNIVSTGECSECLIQLSYAIGMKEPVSFYIKCDGGNKKLEDKIHNWIKKNMDLTPNGIREKLKLDNPIYLPTASYGHFGRKSFERDGINFFPWEKVDLNINI